MAVHLPPGEDKFQRRSVLEAALPSWDAYQELLLIGDFNARDEEISEICERRRLRQVVYTGPTWGAPNNKFHEAFLKAKSPSRGLRYDWMLYRGAMCAVAYVLRERCVFFEGAKFYLSDNFPLLGFLDVHACHGPKWRGAIWLRGLLVGSWRS